MVNPPRIMLNTAIANFNFFALIFLTLNAEKGTESTAPVIRQKANFPLIGFFETTTYVIIPAKQVNPSAKEVIPTALLPSIPVKICPPVTSGPYPPPLIPLLKEAIKPHVIIIPQENWNFLLKKQ